MNTFKLVLKSPLETILDANVNVCHFRALDGEAEVMAKHTDLTAAISFCKLKVKSSDFNHEYIVLNGNLSFDNKSNTCTVMALKISDLKHVDSINAKEMLKKIDQALENGEDISEFKLVALDEMKYAIEQELSQ